MRSAATLSALIFRCHGAPRGAGAAYWECARPQNLSWSEWQDIPPQKLIFCDDLQDAEAHCIRPQLATRYPSRVFGATRVVPGAGKITAGHDIRNFLVVPADYIFCTAALPADSILDAAAKQNVRILWDWRPNEIELAARDWACSLLTASESLPGLTAPIEPAICERMIRSNLSWVGTYSPAQAAKVRKAHEAKERRRIAKKNKKKNTSNHLFLWEVCSLADSLDSLMRRYCFSGMPIGAASPVPNSFRAAYAAVYRLLGTFLGAGYTPRKLLEYYPLGHFIWTAWRTRREATCKYMQKWQRKHRRSLEHFNACARVFDVMLEYMPKRLQRFWSKQNPPRSNWALNIQFHEDVRAGKVKFKPIISKEQIAAAWSAYEQE